MTHNVQQDADALAILEHSSARYIGLLGPAHRTKRVFAAISNRQQGFSDKAKSEQEISGAESLAEYKKPLWNPMGLCLGGELPESIALATCAEIHAVLCGGNGKSMRECR